MTTRWTASSCAVAALAVGYLFAAAQSTVEGQSGSKAGSEPCRLPSARWM